MKKHAGFTLIELMVVMTIIAILATAGLSAYTGYLKNVRDARRIDDISSMNMIILDYLHSYGFSPASIVELNSTVAATNGGQPILDPLHGKVACLTSATTDTLEYCAYRYVKCDNGSGYLLSAKFETPYQARRYTPVQGDSASTEWYYNIGRCIAIDVPPPETIAVALLCRNKADCVPNSVCVGPPPRHCRDKNSQGVGKSCDVNNDCITDKCNKNNKTCEA